MQPNTQYCQPDLYSTYLHTISGTKFTRRQIDILACLSTGRNAKTIANFLGIDSERTVHAHELTIREKLGCGSRDHIIGFLEKCAEFPVLKKYHQILRSHFLFENYSQKIATLVGQIQPKLVIICKDSKEPNKSSILRSLEYYLTQAKIKVFIQKELPTESSDMPFLILDEQTANQNNENQIKHYFKESNNFYLYLFELIKKLLIEIDLTKIENEFKNEFDIIHNSQQTILINGREPVRNQNKPKKTNFSGIHISLLSFFVVFITLLSLYSFSTQNKPAQSSKQPNPKITSYIPELLSGFEKFIGRGNYLKELETALNNGNIVILNGRPGIGKTTCAIEFAKRRKQNNIVRYFDADATIKLEQGYRELGQEFGLNLSGLPNNVVMQLVNNQLHALNANILFIFDNVDKYEDIKNYIINLPVNVKLIITTRQSKLLSSSTHITLKEFNQQEATEYIQTSLNNLILSFADMDELIKTIGKLPYDLKCAAAYLIENPLINTRKISSIIKNEINTSLFKEFAISQDNVKQLAWKILQYTAYLDPDFINVEIFEHLLPQNKLLLQAIKKLESLSLISIISDKTGERGVRIHRELQKTIHYTIIKQSKYTLAKDIIINNLLSALDTLFPDTDHNPSLKWQVADKFLMHVKRILEADNLSQNTTKKLAANLYYKLGKYYSKVNIDLSQALKYAELALHERQSLYVAPNQDIADSLDNIGIIHAFGNYKDIKKGLKYAQEGLKIKQSLYSKNPSDIAISLRNIGLIYYKLGDIKKYLDYVQASLKIRQAIYSTNVHPQLAESLNDVAWGYYELKDYESALKYIEKSVNIYKALYPQGNPEAFYALHTYGALLIQQNNIGGSIKTLNQALDISKRFGMDKHYTTAYVYYDLGRAYLIVKNYKMALEYSEKALELRKELNRINNHPNQMAESLNNLGDIHKALGNKIKALKCYEEALNKILTFSDENHPEIKKIKEKINSLKHNENSILKFWRYLNLNRFIKNFSY